MELRTISQVAKGFGVSTRMLRYYEEIGLVTSLRTRDYAYRMYDETSLRRLQLIILLRKLRISLKEIKGIITDEDAVAAMDVFSKNLQELNDEITVLSTIRTIVRGFVEKFKIKATPPLDTVLLGDQSLLDMIESLSLTKINFQEETSMDKLTKAVEHQSRLKDVRILHLPPFTVAASHYVGEDPEENAGEQLCAFLKTSRLYQVKPDARVFGFNHPNPSQETLHYGYETWVTIPDELEVPAPLRKKHFPGGLYAAHMIVLGNFHEWEWLVRWVANHTKYAANYLDDKGECMGGCLEEHLNYVYHAHLGWPESDEHQLDLLLPIKPRS